MSQRGARMTDFEERDFYPAPRRSSARFEESDRRASRVMTRSPPRRQEELDVRFRERESDRGISFLRDDARRSEPGQMVLRKRDVETWDVHRSPSPPPRVREQRIVHRPRSESPRYREVERERSRTRVTRRRSPSPAVRFVERRRSPSPALREHIRTRIVEREKEREPSPSPSPSPPPVIRGPTIEREVITHYTDVDHGVVRARPPSPRPPTHRERETDIDISLSKGKTGVDVDIRRSTSRHRSRSRERRSHYHDDELVVRDGLDRLRLDDGRRSHRRSRSAAPVTSPVDEEAEFITGKIDSRGRMGEAWHGHTKDWTIVDVPPGTERVRMDGVGGASTETNWSKYSGVRRTTFIPERDGQLVSVPREPSPRPAAGREHTSVTVYDRNREIDVDVDIDRRSGKPKLAPPPTRDMWTEITKDLVCREAIEQMGYAYEETKWFFYIMEYLSYDEVLQLTELTERIRRHRRYYKEVGWERDHRDDWHRYRRHRRPHYEWDDERVREREVIYDSRGPARGYFR
ncbi:uncharacterized protein MAM_02136 [Metarhizium album ARSEF 1941]|uniref:DUF8035 domain-containing protein n=1 Tax=Metarhizium album (strain ARSEF 1941) TaxID=1081103 RepID=A0A0B2X389_METAS|nr:uncharacterized protein MAM_02136 [Metarhizium album ARSEF 1941]KHO00213.1 hypothetical protein MAM_02136 [Metarhizium album ARSEF 1941]